MDEKVMDDQGILMEVIGRKDALDRSLDKYFTGKPCNRGHLSERYVSNGHCMRCKEEYMKEYYQQNKDQILECQREYKQQNKDQILEYHKEYYQQNKEKIKEHYQQNRDQILESTKEYYQQNKEKIVEQKRGYKRNRYATDENYKTSEICRNMLKRTLKATSSTKNSRTYEALGYCNEELKQNIESKFLEDMSWDNYGAWHIDHKYPISRYIQDGTTDPAVINALDNLIPMWNDHNMSKSSMTLGEFLEQEESLAEIYGEFLEAE